MAKPNRRVALRKSVDPIEVIAITRADDIQMIARSAYLLDASSTGFLLRIRREELIPKDLRGNLTLQSLQGVQLSLTIRLMNLEITGIVARTQLVGREGFDVAIDYSANAPEYWRECLVEMLPNPGELELRTRK